MLPHTNAGVCEWLRGSTLSRTASDQIVEERVGKEVWRQHAHTQSGVGHRGVEQFLIPTRLAHRAAGNLEEGGHGALRGCNPKEAAVEQCTAPLEDNLRIVGRFNIGCRALAAATGALWQHDLWHSL